MFNSIFCFAVYSTRGRSERAVPEKYYRSFLLLIPLGGGTRCEHSLSFAQYANADSCAILLITFTALFFLFLEGERAGALFALEGLRTKFRFLFF